jgi:hypothetical protein
MIQLNHHNFPNMMLTILAVLACASSAWAQTPIAYGSVYFNDGVASVGESSLVWF